MVETFDMSVTITARRKLPQDGRVLYPLHAMYFSSHSLCVHLSVVYLLFSFAPTEEYFPNSEPRLCVVIMAVKDI